MIAEKLIVNCIDDAHAIAGAGFAAADPEGRIIAQAGMK